MKNNKPEPDTKLLKLLKHFVQATVPYKNINKIVTAMASTAKASMSWSLSIEGEEILRADVKAHGENDDSEEVKEQRILEVLITILGEKKKFSSAMSVTKDDIESPIPFTVKGGGSRKEITRQIHRGIVIAGQQICVMFDADYIGLSFRTLNGTKISSLRIEKGRKMNMFEGNTDRNKTPPNP